MSLFKNNSLSHFINLKTIIETNVLTMLGVSLFNHFQVKGKRKTVLL